MRLYLLALTCLFSVTSCKFARIGFTQNNEKGAENKDDSQGKTSPTPSQYKPTGTLESLQGGVVTEILVTGKEVVFQPTDATLDLDYKDKETCVNPGIVKADYSIDGKTFSATRSEKNCEPLFVTYTFPTTGIRTISVIYTSRDQETASASISVRVTDPNATPAEKTPSLKLEANPQIGKPGEKFKFKATCQQTAEHVLGWDFGDATPIVKEPAVTNVNSHTHEKEYAYQTPGQITVTVRTEGGSQPLEASTTILVTEASVTPMPSSSSGTPSPTPSSLSSATPRPSSPVQNNPGQNPSQNNPNQNNPNQNK